MIPFDMTNDTDDIKKMKDDIKNEYKIIQEAKPSFTAMTFWDTDLDEYMLPPGCDWETLFNDMYDEYLQCDGKGGRFLKSLQLFLKHTDKHGSDGYKLIRSLNLFTFMIEDDFEESEEKD